MNNKMKKRILFPATFATLIFFFVQTALPQQKTDFSKNGEIHQQVIQSWDNHYRDYFASEIRRRLFEAGDVYVLYDIQIGGLQSFVEMTRRCKDTKQISELVDLLNPVFSALKPISDSDKSTGWICTGGQICKDYKLTGNEVTLCSSQYLGLIGAVATSVEENIPARRRTDAEKAFLANTYSTIAIHLNRWLSDRFLASVDRRMQLTPENIKNGSSSSFFTDKELWFLTALSDLSALHGKGIKPASEDGKAAFEALQNKKKAIHKTFDFFMARTSLSPTANGMRADLDRGFWRLFEDNRYAAYTGSLSPVTWIEDGNGKWEMKTQVPWDSSYIAKDAAWDISHARRLVPALETFARNGKYIRTVWDYKNPAFDPIALRQAFANQIVEKIWNKDMNYPLFSNFWSGDNGWYRVAYAAKETGRRFPGYAPYGLSISIADGGYPIWGSFHPALNAIFKHIFEMSKADDAETKSFVSQHYRRLFGSSRNRGSAKSFPSLSFFADMVELDAAAGGR